MELGFGTAVVYNLCEPIATGGDDLMCTHLAYYRRIYRLIDTFVLRTELLVLPALPCWVKRTRPDGLSLQAFCLIYLVVSMLSYVLFCIRPQYLRHFNAATC